LRSLLFLFEVKKITQLKVELLELAHSKAKTGTIIFFCLKWRRFPANMNCLCGEIGRFVSDVAEVIVLEHNLKRMNEWTNECEAATSF
jgi:hypothetical protein